MDLKTCLEFLIKHGYCALHDKKLIVTKKFSDELMMIGGVTVDTTTIDLTPPEFTANSTDEKKAVWNQFIKDAEIPHRVRAPGGGIYTVRQYSASNADKLIRIIKSTDYRRLVESTKSYYKTVSYKALLSNYIDKDIWRGEYENYDNNKSISSSGENSWEE